MEETIFQYNRATISSQLKSKVGDILTMTAVPHNNNKTLRITLSIDDIPIDSKTHSRITLSIHSSINIVSIFRCSSPQWNPV